MMPIECTGSEGKGWENFVKSKSCPYADNEWMLSYIGYIVEQDPVKPALLSRMVYRAEGYRYLYNLTEVDAPNHCPAYASSLNMFFNGDTKLNIKPLVNPPTGFNTRWMLDKEEIIPYKDQGSTMMMHRATYICEGPWYAIDWNSTTTSVSAGHGISIQQLYDPEPGKWIWQHATIQNQKHPPEIRYNNMTKEWLADPITPIALDYTDKTGYLQKMIKCNVHKYVKDITAFSSPSCEIPLNVADFSVNAHNNSEDFLEIFPPNEVYTGKLFRISAESFVPYSTMGGSMMEWSREYTYQCDPVFYQTVY